MSVWLDSIAAQRVSLPCKELEHWDRHYTPPIFILFTADLSPISMLVPWYEGVLLRLALQFKLLCSVLTHVKAGLPSPSKTATYTYSMQRYIMWRIKHRSSTLRNSLVGSWLGREWKPPTSDEAGLPSHLLPSAPVGNTQVVSEIKTSNNPVKRNYCLPIG